jgi:hypothetical protein
VKGADNHHSVKEVPALSCADALGSSARGLCIHNGCAAGGGICDVPDGVSTTSGPNFSSVKNVSSAVATLDGYAAASWGVTVNVDGAISGIQLVDWSESNSVINLRADHVQISIPGGNGGSPYNLFTTGLVGGTPSIGIKWQPDPH